MTKIKLYPNDTTISEDDKWVGTDGNNFDLTKNFTIAAVGAYINALGVETVSTTDGTFINLTPNTATIGDVVVTADLSATGTPSATTFLRGDNTWATITSGDATTYTFASGQPLAGEVNLTLAHIDEDGVTLLGTNTVKLVAGTNINIADNGSNQITITNTASGSVDGTGTTNYVPKWQDADTLTDSFLQATTDALTTANVSVRWDETTDAYNLSVSVEAAERFKIESGSVRVKNSNLISEGDVYSNGFVKVGTTAELPASEYAGALRYRSDANNSYLEVCMQTGASTYVWHVVQTYTW